MDVGVNPNGTLEPAPAKPQLWLATTAELLPRLREMLRETEATLKADVPLGRLALGGLRGEHRLRVYRDGRIEGLAELGAEKPRAPRRSLGALGLGGSGGALRPSLHAPVPLTLLVAGQVDLRAA